MRFRILTRLLPPALVSIAIGAVSGHAADPAPAPALGEKWNPITGALKPFCKSKNGV